jgi:7-cyano-7-deazaguanine synthase
MLNKSDETQSATPSATPNKDRTKSSYRPRSDHVAFVLLSGGIDSSTCLAIACRETRNEVRAYSIDYGQLHNREIEHAQEICAHFGVLHDTLILSPQPASPLTNKTQNEAIPNKRYDELPEGISPSYHHYRNGQLLSLAAAYASANLLKDEQGIIYAGQHAEDAANWAYADCTPEFLESQATAIWIGTYQRIRLSTPLMWLKKPDIIKLGTQLGIPWRLTYSCYHGGVLHCGVCPTCQARKEGFQLAGVPDPTAYEA